MGDKISQLPAATTVDGTEIVPIVQGGATKKVTGTILRSPTGSAGGDLGGSYPNPTLAAVTTAQAGVGSQSAIPVISIDAKGRVVALSTVANPALTTNQIAGLSTAAGAALATAGAVGLSTFAARADHQHARPTPAEIGALGATAAAGGDLVGNYPNPTLAAITTAQSNVGSGTQVPVLSIDAKGRVTALGSTPISGSAGGTVTSVTAGTGLSGGTITSSGTIAIAAVTTAQSNVGNSTQIPVISINAQGQVTELTSVAASAGVSLTTNAPAALSTQAIVGLSTQAARADHQHLFPTAAQVGALGATAAAGGDLVGNYPNPTLAAITTAQSGIGSASVVPVISVDSKGRVTSLGTAAISSLSTNPPSALATTAVAGLSAFAARLDHQHVFPTAAQVGALGANAAAGGDLVGSYPNPTLAAITTAQSNVGSGSQVPVLNIDAKGRVTSLSSVPLAVSTAAITSLTGDVVAVGPGAAAASLAAITTAQSNVGTATAIPVVSIDTKGRVTALSTVAFAALTTSQIAGLSTTSPAALATSPVIGLSTFAARSDHQHVFPTLGQLGAQAALTTSAPLALSLGGTGEITRQAAMDALAGAVTSGQYLRGNGTDVVMSAIQVGDVPTLNQNTTGTASNVTGTVAIANGGTGATTAAAAASNLGALTTNQIAGLSTAAGAALTTVAIAGLSTFAARADHTHVFPTAANVGALAATAAAGGDLTGNYPNPSLAAITTAQSNVGSSTLIPILSIDAKGRVTALSSVSASAATGLDTFKNRIINGDMLIDQRNGGVASANTISGYFLDRWQVVQAAATGKLIAQQNAGGITPPLGFTKYLGVTSQSSYTVTTNDYYLIHQPIEGQNIRDFGWGSASAVAITLSFWAYSSLTGTFAGAIGNSAGSRTYGFSYSIPTANTWTQISVTIPGDTTGTWLTTNGVGMYLYFSLGVGSVYTVSPGVWISSAGVKFAATGGVSVVGTTGATFYITGVQVEKGSTASSFELLPYTTTIGLCQRYYDTTTMWVPATGDPRQIFYKTSMRSNPTIGGGGTGFAATNQTVNSSSVTQTTAGNQTLTLLSEL